MCVLKMTIVISGQVKNLNRIIIFYQMCPIRFQHLAYLLQCILRKLAPELFRTTAQYTIDWFDIDPLVQTYYTCLTELNPNTNFGRVL
jgi:hypothetical protein